MKKVFLVLTVLLLISCNNTPVSVTTGTQYDQIDLTPVIREVGGIHVAIIGDSRAQNGGDFSGVNASIANWGVGGSTVISSCRRVIYALQSAPNIVVMFTGINDVMTVTQGDFYNYLTAIKYAVNSTGAQFFIFDQSIEPSLATNDIVKGYANIMQVVAGPNYLSMQYDSVDYVDSCHFTESGYSKVFDRINGILGSVNK
jgi:hypothetical protein